MNFRDEDQQKCQQLLTIVDRGNAEQLFTFLQAFHRRPFRNLTEVMAYEGVIDDQIDFIDCTGTKYNVTPLIIAAGKGSYEKTKVLLVHGANPNQQCSTGDTALNLAVHRQKYHIADLLLKYHANPNMCNQSGKTALHRAVVSYIDENANHIRALLHAGADPTLEDRNERLPLDEAVSANKPEIVSVLLSYDRTLTQRAYRAAIIAARLGHDKCLETLLDFGMDPNISDRTRTTPLHIAIRSLKLSTARLLISSGADQHIADHRGETAASIVEYLQADQQQSFINVLTHTSRIGSIDHHKYTTSTMSANVIPYIHPLLRSQPNWTLDSDEFRSRTDINSSVLNLLDASTGTYWCSTQNKDAWVIFDLKHHYNISGMRMIGCDNQSTPKSGHIDVSNALNGPWLKVKDFSCSLSEGTKHDIFFTSLKTRFIRVFILDNHGANDICIQGIGFYGVDMRLVNLLREYGLERSLQTLLANGINDLKTLDEKRDEILNSSDKYLDVNDHFQFIRLTESLISPVLTFLEWFNPPQSTVMAGEKLQTFSAASDEGLTDRVRLEEKVEHSTNIKTVLIRDLEPIQGRSLVDFPDYSIKDPGRYQVRVVSVETPNIQTQWQDIVVVNKPVPLPNQTSSGFASVFPIHRPTSSPPTDLDAELIGIPADFGPSQRFPRTPIPRRRRSRDNSREDTDEDSDTMQRKEKTHPSKDKSQKTKAVDEYTQSEEKKTRNVGTMIETQTRNFGHEVQPQSSATQTSISLKSKPSKALFSYLERSDQTPTPTRESHPEPRKSSRSPHPPQDDICYPRYDRTPYDRPKPRSPSPQICDYSYDDTQYEEHSHRYSPAPEDYHLRRSPSRPTTTITPSRLLISSYRSRTPSPHHRSYTPTPRYPSPPPPRRRPRSATPRHRPQMCSQETDTSLDAMKQRQHAGVQFEPRSTKEQGTTPSLRSKKPPSIHRLSPLNASLYSPHQYSPSSRHQDRSPRTYHSQPTATRTDRYYRDEEEEEEEEEETPSMHDKSTMAELLISFDHFTQCDSQPYMADRCIQTTPPVDENDQGNIFDYSVESDLRQLPRRNSTFIPQPTILQPDTLPRPRRSQYSPVRPKRDGLDYTGNILELSLQRGRQQRTSPTHSSPVLNIGTENVILQSTTDEYTIPFETRYVPDSYGSSTSKPRNYTSIISSAQDSLRTHLFPSSPTHQSKSNGNFYLSNASPRSLNSSFRINIRTD